MIKSDDKNADKKAAQYNPSRRRFLKGVGVAGAGAALADHLLAGDARRIVRLNDRRCVQTVDGAYSTYEHLCLSLPS